VSGNPLPYLKFQAAYVSKITTTFLPCILMNETGYNKECCRFFTAYDIKSSCSIAVHIQCLKGAVAFLTGHWITTVAAKIQEKNTMMQILE